MEKVLYTSRSLNTQNPNLGAPFPSPSFQIGIPTNKLNQWQVMGSIPERHKIESCTRIVLKTMMETFNTPQRFMKTVH